MTGRLIIALLLGIYGGAALVKARLLVDANAAAAAMCDDR